jgi:hypothetical protein
MPQSQKNRAWNRGARLAILYKQMKVNLLNLDKICVTLAKKNRIPTWIGHIPLILVFAGTLAGLLTVGFVISACLIFLYVSPSLQKMSARQLLTMMIQAQAPVTDMVKMDMVIIRVLMTLRLRN